MALADGSVMVMWVIGDGSNTGTAGLLATTLPAGSSIWTAPQVLNDEFAADVDVAAGPDGTLYAVWSGKDETGLTESPRFSLRRPGEAWQPSMVVRTAAPPVYERRGRIGPRVNLRGGRSPQLALGPGGAVLVAWQEDRVVSERLAGYEVHYRTWSPAAGWSGDQAAAPPDSSSNGKLVRSIALAGTKDAFHLLHGDRGDGLFWTMLPAGVSQWSPLKRLPDGSTPSLYARGDQVIASWGLSAALLVQGKEWQLLPKVPSRGESIVGLTEHAPFAVFAHRSDNCMIIAITEYVP